MNYPSLLKRVQALVIDFIILLVVFSVTSLLIGFFGDPPVAVRVIVFVFMFYLYEPLLISLTGGTIGHRLIKLRVCDYDNQQKNINIFKASFRFIIKGALGWISFIIVSFNTEKRSIHDFAGNSIVLYKGN